LNLFFAKWLELKWKKNWNCFKVQPLRGELSNFPRSSWIGVSAKQTKKPYPIEIDSVKWTGKVPVRTAITDTCEGQVSAALLQWQVLRFLRYKLMKWNFSKLLNSNSNCKMNKHAKLRQTNQFTSNFLTIPRCQRSSRKIRQKGPKADLGTKGFVRFNWKKLHRIFITQNYKLSHNIQLTCLLK